MNQHTTIQQLEGLLAYHDAGHKDSILGDLYALADSGNAMTRLVRQLRDLAANCRLKNISLLGLAKAAVDTAEASRLRAPLPAPLAELPPAAP